MASDSDSLPSNHGRELEDGRQKDTISDKNGNRGDSLQPLEEEDGPWYLGKAKEEFRKRRGGQAPPNRGEDDPIQVRFECPIETSLMEQMIVGKRPPERRTRPGWRFWPGRLLRGCNKRGASRRWRC
jgi:hypothetical protein